MRVVLDSNVYVSAFVLPGGAASQLMASLLRGRAEPLISRPIMAEVLGVLGRKFAADREQLARTALFLSGFAEQVVPRERLHVLSDEPDNRILECAVAGHARWIVTGDRQMLKLGCYEGVQIVTVRTMHEYVPGSSRIQELSGDSSRPVMPRLRAIAKAPTQRRTVKLSLNADLFRETQEYHLNLAATLERALVDQLRQLRAERWLAENKDGIAAYNALVEQHGAFADTLRNV